MPYSDPMMDGVTIQRAGTRALERGSAPGTRSPLSRRSPARARQAVVMTYWNLIEHYGPDAFARDLAAAGGAGAITPDLTPDEAQEWLRSRTRTARPDLPGLARPRPTSGCQHGRRMPRLGLRHLGDGRDRRPGQRRPRRRNWSAADPRERSAPRWSGSVSGSPTASRRAR